MNVDYDKKKKNCSIEIEDSIVVIICGEVDIDKLKDALNASVEVKSNTVYTTEK